MYRPSFIRLGCIVLTVLRFGYALQSNAGTDTIATYQCSEGKFAQYLDSEWQCVHCPSGQYQNHAGARECKFCQVGRFQNFAGKTQCKDCSPGRYQNSIGRISCKDCLPGRHQDLPGQPICKKCLVGKYQYRAKQISCKDCPVGKYQTLAGQLHCIHEDSVESHHQDSSKSLRSTIVQHLLGTGRKLNGVQCLAGSYLDGSTCKSCPLGRFNPDDGAEGIDSCVFCPGAKPRTHYVGSSSIGECLECTTGTFENEHGLCASCPGGYYSTLERATDCIACSPGEFGPVGSNAFDNCKSCPPGQYSETPGESCTKCPEGKYLEEAGSIGPCKDCPAGTYSMSGVGQPSGQLCVPCDAGFYSVEEGLFGANACVDCPAGYYQHSKFSSSCLACQPGKFSTAVSATSHNQCVDCSSGKYSGGGSGQTSESVCIDCTPGRFALAGSTSCSEYTSECPPGQELETHDSIHIDRDCNTCQDYYYKIAADDSLCIQGITHCEGNTTYVNKGSPTEPSSCQTCPAGRFDLDDNGENECESQHCVCENGETSGFCTVDSPVKCESCLYGEQVLAGLAEFKDRTSGLCCPHFGDFVHGVCSYCDQHKCLKLKCLDGWTNEDQIVANGCEYKAECNEWKIDNAELSCGKDIQYVKDPLHANSLKFFIDEDALFDVGNESNYDTFAVWNKDTVMELALILKMQYDAQWFGESLAREFTDLPGGVSRDTLDDLTIHDAVNRCLEENKVGICPKFGGLENSYGPNMRDWDTSGVSDMRSLFANRPDLNIDVSKWATHNVVDMSEMFLGCASFNQNLDQWNVLKVKSMRGMFKNSGMNGKIQNWDTQNVKDMSEMFSGATNFAQDISMWKTNSVQTMAGMFENTVAFNGVIGKWDVSNVVNMTRMFKNARLFGISSGIDPLLRNWDVGQVKYMEEMFANSVFNFDIHTWDVSNVISMRRMFFNSKFNKQLFTTKKDGQKVLVTKRSTDGEEKTDVYFFGYGDYCEKNGQVVDCATISNVGEGLRTQLGIRNTEPVVVESIVTVGPGACKNANGEYLPLHHKQGLTEQECKQICEDSRYCSGYIWTKWPEVNSFAAWRSGHWRNKFDNCGLYGIHAYTLFSGFTPRGQPVADFNIVGSGGSTTTTVVFMKRPRQKVPHGLGIAVANMYGFSVYYDTYNLLSPYVLQPPWRDIPDQSAYCHKKVVTETRNYTVDTSGSVSSAENPDFQEYVIVQTSTSTSRTSKVMRILDQAQLGASSNYYGAIDRIETHAESTIVAGSDIQAFKTAPMSYSRTNPTFIPGSRTDPSTRYTTLGQGKCLQDIGRLLPSDPLYNIDPIIECMNQCYGTYQVRVFSVINGECACAHSSDPLCENVAIDGFDASTVYRMHEPTITFDSSDYLLCTGQAASVTWNGRHNIYETTKDKYDSGDVENGLAERVDFKDSGTKLSFHMLGAEPGKTRYFLCQAHPNAKFTTRCPYGDLSDYPDFVETTLELKHTAIIDSVETDIYTETFQWNGSFPLSRVSYTVRPGTGKCTDSITMSNAQVQNEQECMEKCVKAWSHSPENYGNKAFSIEEGGTCRCSSGNCPRDSTPGHSVYDITIPSTVTTYGSYIMTEDTAENVQVIITYDVHPYESEISSETSDDESTMLVLPLAERSSSKWSTISLQDGSGMFENASFNMDIIGIDTSSALTLKDMFKFNEIFDKPIYEDPLHSVQLANIDVTSMFEEATGMSHFFPSSLLTSTQNRNKMFRGAPALAGLNCERSIFMTSTVPRRCEDHYTGIMQFEGEEDNPGPYAQKFERCAEKCLDSGAIVLHESGKCFCSPSSPQDCTFEEYTPPGVSTIQFDHSLDVRTCGVPVIDIYDAVDKCLDEDPVFGECHTYGFESKLGTMPNWDTSLISDMKELFMDRGVLSVDLGSWNVGSVTDMTRMFQDTEIEPMVIAKRIIRKYTGDTLVTTTTVSTLEKTSAEDLQTTTNETTRICKLTYLNVTLETLQRDVTFREVRKDDVVVEATIDGMPYTYPNIPELYLLGCEFEPSESIIMSYQSSGDAMEMKWNWDTSKVESMESMFERARFNLEVNDWNVDSVTSMKRMFKDCTDFNQPLFKWYVNNVQDMNEMLYSDTPGTMAFRQDISMWNPNIETLCPSSAGCVLEDGVVKTKNESNCINMPSLLEAECKNVYWQKPKCTKRVKNWPNTLVSITGWSGQNCVDYLFNGVNMGLGQTCQYLVRSANDWDPNDPARNCVSDDTYEATYESGFCHGAPHFTDQSGCDSVYWEFIPQYTMHLLDHGSYGEIGYCEGIDTDDQNECASEWEEGKCLMVNENGHQIANYAFNIGETLCKTDATGQNTTNGVYRGWDQELDNCNFPFPEDLAGIPSAAKELMCYSLWVPGHCSGAEHITTQAQCSIEWKTETGWSGYKDSFTCENGPFDCECDQPCSLQPIIHNNNIHPHVDACLDESPTGNCQLHPFGPLSSWDVSPVTNMAHLFEDKDQFSGDVSSWDVSRVRNMKAMFKGAAIFSGDVGAWDTSKVDNMESMFQDASSFNGDLSGWDISKTVTTKHMFSGASLFKGDGIDQWDVALVQDMTGMFNDATSLDVLLDWVHGTTWTDIQTEIFQNAHTFNARYTCKNNRFPCMYTPSGQQLAFLVEKCLEEEPIRGLCANFADDVKLPPRMQDWDVSEFTSMVGLFKDKIYFQGDLSEWDVKNVVDMSSMFEGAESFKSDLSGWNTQSVTAMDKMFKGAVQFMPHLGEWDISNVKSMHEMFADIPDMRDLTLEKWNDAWQPYSAVDSGLCSDERAKSVDQQQCIDVAKDVCKTQLEQCTGAIDCSAKVGSYCYSLFELESDADGDGVPDSKDAFPTDPYEYIDADQDGLGDNRTDRYPNDSDNDGVINDEDAYPWDPARNKTTLCSTMYCGSGYKVAHPNNTCVSATCTIFADRDNCCEEFNCPAGQGFDNALNKCVVCDANHPPQWNAANDRSPCGDHTGCPNSNEFFVFSNTSNDVCETCLQGTQATDAFATECTAITHVCSLPFDCSNAAVDVCQASGASEVTSGFHLNHYYQSCCYWTGTGCVENNCGENERVLNNVCVPCETGHVRPAGDNPSGEDTECFPALAIGSGSDRGQCQTCDLSIRIGQCNDFDYPVYYNGKTLQTCYETCRDGGYKNFLFGGTSNTRCYCGRGDPKTCTLDTTYTWNMYDIAAFNNNGCASDLECMRPTDLTQNVDYTWAHDGECAGEEKFRGTGYTVKTCADACRGYSWGDNNYAKGFIFRHPDHDANDGKCYCESSHSHPHADCPTKISETSWERYDFDVPYIPDVPGCEPSGVDVSDSYGVCIPPPPPTCAGVGNDFCGNTHIYDHNKAATTCAGDPCTVSECCVEFKIITSGSCTDESDWGNLDNAQCEQYQAQRGSGFFKGMDHVDQWHSNGYSTTGHPPYCTTRGNSGGVTNGDTWFNKAFESTHAISTTYQGVCIKKALTPPPPPTCSNVGNDFCGNTHIYDHNKAATTCAGDTCTVSECCVEFKIITSGSCTDESDWGNLDNTQCEQYQAQRGSGFFKGNDYVASWTSNGYYAPTGHPPYCTTRGNSGGVTNGDTWFNSTFQSTDAISTTYQGVCIKKALILRTSYIYTQDSADCGFITSYDECQTAANALCDAGYDECDRNIHSTSINHPGLPRGCIISPGNDAYFNADTTVTNCAKSNYGCICKTSSLTRTSSLHTRSLGTSLDTRSELGNVRKMYRLGITGGYPTSYKGTFNSDSSFKTTLANSGTKTEQSLANECALWCYNKDPNHGDKDEIKGFMVKTDGECRCSMALSFTGTTQDTSYKSYDFYRGFMSVQPAMDGPMFVAEHIEDRNCDYSNIRVAEPIINRAHSQAITDAKYGAGTVMTSAHFLENCLEACTNLRYDSTHHREGFDKKWSENLLGQSKKIHGLFLHTGYDSFAAGGSNDEWTGRCACTSQDPEIAAKKPDVSCNTHWVSYRIVGDPEPYPEHLGHQSRRLNSFSSDMIQIINDAKVNLTLISDMNEPTGCSIKNNSISFNVATTSAPCDGNTCLCTKESDLFKGSVVMENDLGCRTLKECQFSVGNQLTDNTIRHAVKSCIRSAISFAPNKPVRTAVNRKCRITDSSHQLSHSYRLIPRSDYPRRFGIPASKLNEWSVCIRGLDPLQSNTRLYMGGGGFMTSAAQCTDSCIAPSLPTQCRDRCIAKNASSTTQCTNKCITEGENSCRDRCIAEGANFCRDRCIAQGANFFAIESSRRSDWYNEWTTHCRCFKRCTMYEPNYKVSQQNHENKEVWFLGSKKYDKFDLKMYELTKDVEEYAEKCASECYDAVTGEPRMFTVDKQAQCSCCASTDTVKKADKYAYSVSTIPAGEVAISCSDYEDSSDYGAIKNWNTSKVTNMSRVFADYGSIDFDISNWDTSNVLDMSGMFKDTTFRSDISSMDVSNVRNMASMFSGSLEFNQDISGWNTANVERMDEMFRGARRFDADISGWNTAKVDDMSKILEGAVEFDRDISGWVLPPWYGRKDMIRGAHTLLKNCEKYECWKFS